MEDGNFITKDYRELQEENAQHQSGVAAPASSLSDLLRNNPMPVVNPAGLRATAADWNRQYYNDQQLDYSDEVLESGYGTDKRDKAIDLTALNDPNHDLTHYRAKVQSGASKLLNGTAKFVPVMLTTFADGIVGTIAGAFNAAGYLMGPDEDKTLRETFNAFVDNPISQSLLGVQDYFEKVLPNYYTDEELNDNGKWWTHINANMIGDQFIKNLGFTAGAMASGMVASGVTQYLRTGAGKAARNIIKAGAGAKAGDTAAKEGLRKIALTRGDNAAALKESAKATRNFRKLSLFDQVAGGVGGAMGEARIEALHAAREYYDDALQSLDNQFSDFLDTVGDGYTDSTEDQAAVKEMVDKASQKYAERKEYLDELATRVANTVFICNVPLLAFDNVFEFGKLFGGGFKTMRNSLRNVRRAGGEYVGRGSVAGAIASGIAKPLVEGFEELNQKVISEGAKDVAKKNMASFYNDGKDAVAINNFGEWLGSMLQSGVDVYADPSSWQEFAIGFLTGSISYYTGKDANGKGRWAGGIGATIKDKLDEKKENAKMAKALNDYVSNGKLKDLIDTYVRHSKYTDTMADAAEVGDKFVYHTAEDKDLINLVSYFHKAGRTADLNEFIDRFSTLTDEDVQQVKEALRNEDGSLIVPGTTESEDDQVRSFVKDRADALKKTVKSYVEAYDSIAGRAPLETPREVLVEYAYTAAMLDKFDDRFFSIWEGEQNDDGTHKPGVKDKLRAFFAQEAAVAHNREGKKLTKEEQAVFVEDQMSKAEDLLRGSEKLNIRTGAFEDTLNAGQLLGKLNSIKKELEAKKETVDPELLSDLQDMVKLISARKNYYRALADPKHNILAKFNSDQKSDDEARNEAQAEADKRATADMPDFASVQDVKAWVTDPSVSANERSKRATLLEKKKGNEAVDTYNKMQAASTAMQLNVRKYSKNREAIEDVQAMLAYVLDQQNVTDLKSLYDFAFPEPKDMASPESGFDLEAWKKLLSTYNSTAAISANPFGVEDDAQLAKRYKAAYPLYVKTINQAKKANYVVGVQDEYGQPLRKATPRPAPENNPSNPFMFEEPEEPEEVKPEEAPEVAPETAPEAKSTPEVTPTPAPASASEPVAEPTLQPQPAPVSPMQETPSVDETPTPATNPSSITTPEAKPEEKPRAQIPQVNPTPTSSASEFKAQGAEVTAQSNSVRAKGNTARLQVTDDKQRDTQGKVLFETSAIPQKDWEEMTKFRSGQPADLRDMDVIAYEKLQKSVRDKKDIPGSGDYRAISALLRNHNGRNAFDFVNTGRLHKGDDISFTIYPSDVFSNGTDTPTVFMTYGNNLVGVLRDAPSTYGGKEIYGHKELHEEIKKEYEKWKKTHNPQTDTFTFSKKSKVWGLRKGMIVFSESGKENPANNRALNEVPGYDKKAAIVLMSENEGVVPVLNADSDTLAKLNRSRLVDSMQTWGLYYLAPNVDGSKIPVRLILSRFATDEPAGAETSSVYKAVFDRLKTLFEDEGLYDLDDRTGAFAVATEAKDDLNKLIYLGSETAFSVGVPANGMPTFRVFRAKIDEDGNVIYKDNGKKDYETLFDVELVGEDGNRRSAEDLAKNVIVGLQVRLKPIIQVDVSSAPAARKAMSQYVNEGLVSVNAESLIPVDGGFYIDPYDPATKQFMPVFKDSTAKTTGVSENSADAKARKAREAKEAAREQTESDAQPEIQRLEKYRNRLTVISDAQFNDPSIVSPEVRGELARSYKVMVDTIAERTNFVKAVEALYAFKNAILEAGVIPEAGYKGLKLAEKTLEQAGYILEDPYGKQYSEGQRNNLVSVKRHSIHAPVGVWVVSKTILPIIKKKDGTVVRNAKVEVSVGDGTAQILRFRQDIDFDEASHTYTRKSDNKVLEGVTTLLTNQGVGVNYSEVGNGDPIKRKKILAKAAARGTAIHAAIEDYDNGVDRDAEGNFVGPKTRVVDAIDQDTGEVLETFSVSVAPAVNAYKKLGLPVIESEYLISDGENFASMIDKVLKVDDNTVDLVDLKTTASLHTDALSWQLSIYAYLFEKQNPGVKVRNLQGAHIQKNGTITLVQVDRHSNEEVEALMAKEVTTLPVEENLAPAEQVPDTMVDEQETGVSYMGEGNDTAWMDADAEDNDYGAYMSTEQAGKHKTRADLQAELAWLDKALPHIKEQDRLIIKKGLINMSNADGWAFGKVRNGLMIISEDAAEGTVYHEAFHWITQYVLSDIERKGVFGEAMRIYGTRDVRALEELMADDFREWMLTGRTKNDTLMGAFDGRGFFKSIGEFFRRLYAMITNKRSLMPQILAVYTSLNEGRYAQSEEIISDTSEYSVRTDNPKAIIDKISKLDSSHIADVVGVKENKDGTATVEYMTPKGRQLSEQDATFQQKHIDEAMDALRQISKNGLTVDLTTGLNTVYYTANEGFVFTSVYPGAASESKLTEDFAKLLGKTGLNYQYLAEETKEELQKKGYNESRYNDASQAEKDHLIRCIGV